MGRARCVAVVTLVVILAGNALVAALPGSLVAVRVSGVALAWWAWALALIGAAIAGALAVVPRHVPAGDDGAASEAGRAGMGNLLCWASPALLVSVAALVLGGAPAAPLVATAALAAPLLGSLLTGGAGPATAVVERAVTPVVAALLLAAQLLVAGDFALALGYGRGHGIAAAALLVVASPGRRGVRLRHATAMAGALAVALGVGVVWSQTSTPPWTAWSVVASRPLLAFSDQALAVTRGVDVLAPATLTFTEAQRVTALTAGVYRVVERDGPRPVMREWRLTAGESLSVRTGDALVLGAGVRVRFEAGKRVPGAPDSGVVWGEPRGRTPLAALGTFLGAVLTLAGLGAGGPGAGRPRTAELAAVAGGLLLVVAAVTWGIYGALAGADVALGSPLVWSLIEGARVLAPSAGGVPASLLAIGCLALLAGLAPALREQVTHAVAPSTREPAREWAAWIAVVAAAAVVAVLAPVDAWRALALGGGLAASVLVAPRLVGAPRARAVARVAGAAAFVVTALAAGRAGSVVAAYPALVAVPLAWAAGWLLDQSRSGRAAVR